MSSRDPLKEVSKIGREDAQRRMSEDERRERGWICRVDGAESSARSWVPTTGLLKLFQTEPWVPIFPAPVGGRVVWFKARAPRQFVGVPLTAALPARRDAVTKDLADDLDRDCLFVVDTGEPVRVLGNRPERWLEEMGEYELNGVPDRWRLFRATS